jgi:pimeloyl-ACP methyl ester carboxylesterase
MLHIKSRHLLALFFGVQISAVVASNTSVAQTLPDQSFTPYMKPQLLVDVPGNRKIHLYCSGSGSPTVIFSAGLGDWVADWRKIQTPIALKTRTCGWDRAGFGFSDASPEVQDITNTTADMEAAFKAAKIEGPFVLVGHSMGGYETLLFADKHLSQLQGMVLIDPTTPHQFKNAKFFDDYFALTSNKLGKCLAEIKNGKLSLNSTDPNKCFEYDTDYPLELTKSLKAMDIKPERYRSLISLFDNLKKNSKIIVNPKRNYGAIPMRVFSAGEPGDWSTTLGLSSATAIQHKQFDSDFKRGHDAMARLSTNGSNVVVSGATHYIHKIKPEVVIAAIEEVVEQARKNPINAAMKKAKAD